MIIYDETKVRLVIMSTMFIDDLFMFNMEIFIDIFFAKNMF